MKPSGQIFPGRISAKWIEETVFLDSKDVGTLHLDLVEIGLGDVSFQSEQNGGVTMKPMGGGFSNITR